MSHEGNFNSPSNQQFSTLPWLLRLQWCLQGNPWQLLALNYLDGYLSAKSMEEMKNKLEEGMLQIQAVLDVTNPDQFKEHSVALDLWFWKLRDAVEEAEDAIDELEYYKLKEKAKDYKSPLASRNGNLEE
uniref:Disease resistance N-terminal domain-containing protein n=1 Tax=Oryza nivara TaxID=4536 RepID=A0A0E0J7Z8_ORYNI